jgi:pyruvate dehydrogenase E2 component (dihydrolipoamide acetyltransferase)
MEEIYMPNLGMTMIEGKVLEWYAEDGAQVSEGQDIVEVASETGKLNMVIQAPVSGKLIHKIKVEEPVEIGGVIAVIE